MRLPPNPAVGFVRGGPGVDETEVQGLRRFLVLHAALALCLLGVGELVVRTRPALLPGWYRASFPLGGVEFFEPGLLSATPIEGYPVPGPQRPYAGLPSADLVEAFGLVDPASNPDPERFPRIKLPIDVLGFPNERALDAADVVVMGDSFALAAGVTSPPGLCRELERTTGLAVYNLGVPGIGPLREAWLLERYGLPLRPRFVVWLFFGGNSIGDAEETLRARQLGVRTFSDMPGYRALPRSRVLGWIDSLLFGVEHSDFGQLTFRMPVLHHAAHVEPVHLRTGADSDLPLWFAPGHLQALVRDESSWRHSPGMAPSLEAIRAVRSVTRRAGADLILVYVPSKAQALLQHVEQDHDALMAMATFGLDESIGIDPEVALAAALANRGSLENLLFEFCEEAGIPLLSATPYLEAQAAEGTLGYLSADTHWNTKGQLVLVEPLARAFARLSARD